MKISVIFFFVVLLVFPLSGFGFTFSVTPTNETCTGNATLTFSPAGNDPNGTIVYKVYKLPDLAVPLVSVTGNFVNGLSAGDYRIVAEEKVGGVVTSTHQQDVTITSAIVPFSFMISSANQACSTTSNLMVNVLSGVASNYEIFSGPSTFPLQSGNTFSGLPSGLYGVRVFDNCGNGNVQNYTVTLNTAILTIGSPVFSNTNPASCNQTVVTNTVTPAAGTVIGYPLTIQYIVNPPNGANPIIINNTVSSGDPNSQDISTTIPLYINQTYSYDVSITDGCQTQYLNSFVADPNISLVANVKPLDCDQNYFSLFVTNFNPPYNLNFTNFPAGFNPSTFNSNYPNAYSSNNVDFGSMTNPTPLGSYSIDIVDACGRIGTVNFNIDSKPPIPVSSAENNGCLTNSGKITVNIPNYQISSAIISVAPATYPFTLPHNVTSQIDSTGNLIINPVPTGDYTILITDTCNNTLPPILVKVPIYANKGLLSDVRQGCDLNQGGIKLLSVNGKLISVMMNLAPPGFQSTPFDVTNNIASNGIFYMENLPAGNYKFTLVDECNFTNNISVTIDGYQITSNTVTLNKNCGSFDLFLNFVSNANVNESFFLQRLNPTTNTWEHPGTGVAYPEGTVPTSINSYPLTNLTTNFNLTFNGNFRVIRHFSSYNNGSNFNAGVVTNIDKDCIEILPQSLSFKESLEILDAYRIPCTASGSLDVVILANGSLPLHYTIVGADNTTVLADNGTSNVFVNLQPGSYNFKVQDPCGGSRVRPFDVSALVSIVNITKPDDLLQCQNTITGSESFDLISQNPKILGTQSPTQYSINYYVSPTDAQSATNPIPNPSTFVPTQNPQRIYVRLFFNQLPNCYETTFFDLYIGQNPKLNLNSDYLSCSNVPVTLDVSTNNLSSTTYLWSNGATTSSVIITQTGITNISVTATNSYVPNLPPCTNTQSISVNIPIIPTFDHIETVDWTENENSITVFTSNPADFEYSLDGINFQNENLFAHLNSGLYTVYIKDKFDCNTTQQVVWLLDYPKYFTPNGDGYNDTWFIKNANFEPDFRVIIYDRFGKLINSFNSNSAGWDGTYNGNLMFATDYWFVVYRQDGRELKGHFALKR